MQRKRKRTVTLLGVTGATAAAMLTAVSGGSAAYQTAGYTIWRIAGDGTACSTSPTCGDGGPATDAQLNVPRGVAVDAAGNVIIADNTDHTVRLVTPSGTISRIAGNGVNCATPPSCGDGGPATSAQLRSPTGVAIDAAGNIYVSDTNAHEIRKLAPDGTISRFAGTGVACAAPPSCGDGGPASSAQLNTPFQLAVDSAGNVYIADFGTNEIRKVAPDGTITRFAGTGVACAAPPSCGDGGPATNAQLQGPIDVVADGSGILIADANNHEIRRVSLGGTMSRIAGNGTPCGAPPSCGDGGAATSAQLNGPNGVEVDGAGNILIADTGNNEIRRIAPNGTITRIAGNGTQCPGAQRPACGDGGAASEARLVLPTSLAVSPLGGIVFADFGASTVRWLSGPQAGATGATGPAGAAGPQGPAGTPGAPGAPGADGELVLVAYKAGRTARRVAVNFALTGPAAISLYVTPPKGKRVRIARSTGHAGINRISWNRRLGGKRAKAGKYRLTVVARVGGDTASSALSVRLR